MECLLNKQVLIYLDGGTYDITIADFGEIGTECASCLTLIATFGSL